MSKNSISKIILITGFLVMICQFTFSQTNQWYTFPANTPESANRYIHVDNNDVKWVGGYSGGLHKFSNGNWTTYSTSNSSISDNDVRESSFDTLGNLWVTTWNGLNKFDTLLNSWTNYNVTGQTNDILYSVQVDGNNHVWVGTDGGAGATDGLYMFDGTNWTFYNPVNSSLSGKWIVQLKKDKTGKIWGCHYLGLFEINDTTVTNHLLVPAGFPVNTSATCVDFDSYNNKWVGVYDGGIGKFAGSNWTIYNAGNSPLPEDKIWSIAVDQNNVVWIGTETKGLVKFDGTNWTIYNTTNSTITNDRIDALAVDKLNNLWIACSYGGILVHNPQGLSGISGYVYYDANNNHIKDSGESALPNQVISVDSSIFLAITNASGDYNCAILNAGSYTAKLNTHSPYITGVFPDSINFTINTSVTNITNTNFGLQMQPNIHDLTVDYTSLNAPRPGFSYAGILTVKNAGSAVSTNVNVYMKYDANMVFDSSSTPFISHNGDSISWLINSLDLFEQKNIKIFFHLPPNPGLIGSFLTTAVKVNDANADNDISNNSFALIDKVIGAYDPNNKTVEPQGSGITGDIPANTSDLTYTIRFQNTGTAPAIEVVIKDTINTNLDLSSIQMLSSSHFFTAEIKNGGIIWWHFNQINLPDSNSNEPASHGYIKFKIKLKTAIPIATQIKNTAYIYFDFNPAIVTNQTVNTIIAPTSGIVNQASDYTMFSLFPNPALNCLYLETVYHQSGFYSVKIIDNTGRIVYSLSNLNTHFLKIDISKIPAGLYNVLLVSEHLIQQKKFIKID